jgi:hypothetical protein
LEDGVTGISVTEALNSTEDTKVTPDSTNRNFKRAVKKLKASKNHPKALIAVAHLSNKELSEELLNTCSWKDE